MSKILVEEVQNVTYTVDGKAYKNKEAADAALASLENVQEGLEFTEALYAGLATRAKRTKANLIGEYLDWVADGKPVVVEEEPASA
jgi:hypothetical protein